MKIFIALLAAILLSGCGATGFGAAGGVSRGPHGRGGAALGFAASGGGSVGPNMAGPSRPLTEKEIFLQSLPTREVGGEQLEASDVHLGRSAGGCVQRGGRLMPDFTRPMPLPTGNGIRYPLKCEGRA